MSQFTWFRPQKPMESGEKLAAHNQGWSNPSLIPSVM